MTTKDFTFGLVDYIFFSIMLGASFSVGVYFGFFAKSKNTTDEYLMGSKEMKVIPTAISLVASQLSCVAILSVPAETFIYGFYYLYFIIANLLMAPVIAFIIVPIFYDNQFTNCYEMRFNKQSRQLITATFILSTLLVLPAYMFGPALAFSQVSGLNVHLINAVLCSICMFYTMVGGIKAVVWTDVIQGGIMLVAVIIVAVMGTIKLGGPMKVFEYANEGGRLDTRTSLDPRTRLTVWNSLLSGSVLWISYIGLNQSCVQRIVSLPTLKQAQKTILLTGLGVLLIMGFTLLNGLIMYAYYRNCDPMLAGHVKKPDQLISFFVQDIVGNLKGLPGIFTSSIFSASLSTLSANLNSVAGVVYFDYVKPCIKHTEGKANFIMKLLVFIMGCYCIAAGFIIENSNSILQIIVTAVGINAGAIVGIFFIGIFMPRINGKVALVATTLTILLMGWLVFENYFRMYNGEIKHQTLPTNIDNCEAVNIEILSRNITTTLSTQNVFRSDFSVFDISFYWFKILGVVITVIIAIPLSFVWKSKDNEKLNPKLFSPFVRKSLTSRDIEMEETEPLKTITTKTISIQQKTT